MRQQTNSTENGFTLIEALLALAIVALVVTTALSIRTSALVDATEARNWRVAREVAQEVLSELRAGARDEVVDFRMRREPIPKMKDIEGWSYQIAIGDQAIADVEAELTAFVGEDTSSRDRLEWQQERDDLRASRKAGQSYYEYREQSRLAEEERLETEDLPPSEDEYEEVAVFVFFPNTRGIVGGVGNETAHFVLKARISTLAIEGLTPDEAEAANGTQGSDPDGTGGDGR